VGKEKKKEWVEAEEEGGFPSLSQREERKNRSSKKEGGMSHFSPRTQRRRRISAARAKEKGERIISIFHSVPEKSDGLRRGKRAPSAFAIMRKGREKKGRTVSQKKRKNLSCQEGKGRKRKVSNARERGRNGPSFIL